MEQSPKICPRCHQANFPIAEFCRHCGEPIFEMGSLSRTSFFSRWVGHLVDGFFWVFDEFLRWVEIAKMSRTAKRLRKRRQEITDQFAGHDVSGMPAESREKLVNISEDLARMANQEETLRRKSWAMTPELIFVVVSLIFVAGLIWLNPRGGEILLPGSGQQMTFKGQILSQTEFAIPPQGVVTTSAWFNGKLYIGGDSGLFSVDPVQGVASFVTVIPKDFFVRHLISEGNRLLIAGYGGAFSFDGTSLSSLYEKDKLPVTLINRIASVKDGHLLGTVGQGLLKGRRGLAVVVLGTPGLVINGLAWLDGDLWLLHERGLMRGDGANFSPVQIQVLDGKKLSAMVSSSNALFVGTNEGVVAAFKTNQNWVWTPLTQGGPRSVSDLAVSGDTLLVTADDGLFRYENGVFEKLSPRTGQRLLVPGSDYVATVGRDKVVFYRFAQVGSSSTPMGIPILPSVGTFSESVATTSGLLPIPSVSPGSPLPVVSPPPVSPGNSQQSLVPVTILDTTPPAEISGAGVNSIVGDLNRLWVGTTNQGLWLLENRTWRKFDRSNGQLPDDQVVSFWQLQGKPFLFSWVSGIMSMDSGRPVQVLAASQAKGFVAIGGDPNSPVALFEGGKVFRIANGALQNIGQFQEVFHKTARSIQVMNGVIHVIADQGILIQKSAEEWGMNWFPSNLSARVKSVVSGEPGKIYVGKADGNVLMFSGDQVVSLGSINEPISAVSFDGSLWVAGVNTVFRLSGNSLVPVTQRIPESIIAFKVFPDRRNVVLVTSNGMKSVPLTM